MKKIALFAMAVASLFGASQLSAQEVTYVEDCSQGLLINRMQDNWFITAQGGANWFNSNYDTEAAMKNRIGASAAIYVGKWFTPVWGFRLGASANILRGATNEHGAFRDMAQGAIGAGGHGEMYYPERIMQIGPEIDLMLSLTNWWCGYNPNRVYNGVVHIGGGGYWNASHSRMCPEHNKWEWQNAHNRTLFASLGYTNNFAVSKQVDLFLDIQYTVEDFSVLDRTYAAEGTKDMTGFLTVSAGFTYKFKKRDWNCPITAVCPTWKYTDAEGDALVAKLAQANNKIADLQRQLDECLNRPQKECVNALATIYYPINVSSLSNREVTLVQSMAKIMQKNPDKKYILTGWADNYTGNDKINTRLRNERVDGVYNCLIKAGVPASQLEKRIDANNLTDYGLKGAQFDRAVTVIEAN